MCFPKKDLNKALLTAVQVCSSSNIDEMVLCVNALLSNGANIDAEETSTAKTALMIACEKGYILLIEQLLDMEAQVNHRDML